MHVHICQAISTHSTHLHEDVVAGDSQLPARDVETRRSSARRHHEPGARYHLHTQPAVSVSVSVSRSVRHTRLNIIKTSVYTYTISLKSYPSSPLTLVSLPLLISKLFGPTNLPSMLKYSMPFSLTVTRYPKLSPLMYPCMFPTRVDQLMLARSPSCRTVPQRHARLEV